MNKAIRWQQRFENFEKAYLLLDEVVINYNIAKLSELEKSGVIQRFEMLIELSWKLLNDYLKDQGFTNMDTPKDVMRQAYAAKIIQNTETWLQALDQRNSTSHNYDEQLLEATISFIMNNFYQVVTELYQYFKDKN